jgi:hypothetical protein
MKLLKANNQMEHKHLQSNPIVRFGEENNVFLKKLFWWYVPVPFSVQACLNLGSIYWQGLLGLSQHLAPPPLKKKLFSSGDNTTNTNDDNIVILLKNTLVRIVIICVLVVKSA